MKIIILVLFLKAGYSGGVTTIAYPNEIACTAALIKARAMRSYEDGACLPGPDPLEVLK